MNNYNNNFYPGQGGGYYGGAYLSQAPDLHMSQGLTPEQIKSLRKSGGFALDVKEDEILRSYCTHRQGNKFTLIQDDEGNSTCTLCGTRFKPFNGTVAEARQLTEDFLGLVETAKTQAINLPPKVIQEFFQFEPLVKRVPDLFAQSNGEYKKALGMDQYVYGQENNAFQTYQNIINPMVGNGYYDPAMMGYGQQQPMMNGYQQQPQMNGMAYGQQQMGYNPGMNAYGQQQMNQMNTGFAQQQGNPFNVNDAAVVNQNQQAQAVQQPETVTVSANMKD